MPAFLAANNAVRARAAKLDIDSRARMSTDEPGTAATGNGFTNMCTDVIPPADIVGSLLNILSSASAARP